MINIVGKTPCFRLLYSNGYPVDAGDCIPHFPDHASAAHAAPRYQINSDLSINGEVPVPKQLDAACVSISCDKCDDAIDENDAMTYHFLPDEVAGAIEGWEWTIRGDQMLCPKCAAAYLPGSAAEHGSTAP